jgi:methionine sulfoxide reductase heme-binding subunit
MVPKISLKSNLWLRHCIVGIPSLVSVTIFWFTRMEWDPEMRFWRAVGDASLLLLWLVLVIGPLSRVWLATRPLLSWRREIGI